MQCVMRKLGLVLGVSLLVSACSSVTLKPEPPAIAAEFRVDADDTLAVDVAAQPGVAITDEELARCAKTITERALRQAKDTAADGNPRAWKLLVTISRYDHGNAFKRRVQAGMGGMYIDSRVAMFAADGTPVGEFAANRAYEWGGTLGEQATIDDLEVMLGDYIGRAIASRGVAATVKEDVPVEKALFGPAPQYNKAQQHAPVR